MEERFIAIAALQHYAFCPRQFALIHIEQSWEDNYFTAEGQLLHERVDSEEAEQRGKLRYERSVLLNSERYKIQGKMDLLEIETLPDQSLSFFPVEYKRGKPKTENWDRVQLCAQALCIEEMRNIVINEGALWYWEIRRRDPIIIDAALREETIAIIQQAHELIHSNKTPPPIYEQKRCRACSLSDICQPKIFKKDYSQQYIAEIFKNEFISTDNLMEES